MRKQEDERLFDAILIAMLAITLLAGGKKAFANPLREAEPYRATLVREARSIWGMNAPILVFAAQLHQESAWNPTAKSKYANGLAQFTKDTATDMARWYPELNPADPFNPRWSIRAMVRYDRRLFGQVKGRTQCDIWHATLRSYNGGFGHWRTESRAASDPLDRQSVAQQCGVGKRGKSHCKENLGYPQKILQQHAPRYQLWGGINPC